MRVEVDVELTDIIPHCGDKDFLAFVTTIIDSIDSEGVIDEVRKIVNDPKYNDQPEESIQEPDDPNRVEPEEDEDES